MIYLIYFLKVTLYKTPFKTYQLLVYNVSNIYKYSFDNNNNKYF